MLCGVYAIFTEALTRTPHVSTAVVDCGRPPFVFMSSFKPPETTVGTTITYTCFTGHRLVGEKDRICQADGQWSGNTPQCVGTYMPANMDVTQKMCSKVCIPVTENRQSYIHVCTLSKVFNQQAT